MSERIALRPDDRGWLDDVVVSNVAMFRMERMDKDWFWLCCYLDDEPGSLDRICWTMKRDGKAVRAITTEFPSGVPADQYEPGSPRNYRESSSLENGLITPRDFRDCA